VDAGVCSLIDRENGAARYACGFECQKPSPKSVSVWLPQALLRISARSSQRAIFSLFFLSLTVPMCRFDVELVRQAQHPSREHDSRFRASSQIAYQSRLIDYWVRFAGSHIPRIRLLGTYRAVVRTRDDLSRRLFLFENLDAIQRTMCVAERIDKHHAKN